MTSEKQRTEKLVMRASKPGTTKHYLFPVGRLANCVSFGSAACIMTDKRSHRTQSLINKI